MTFGADSAAAGRQTPKLLGILHLKIGETRLEQFVADTLSCGAIC